MKNFKPYVSSVDRISKEDLSMVNSQALWIFRSSDIASTFFPLITEKPSSTSKNTAAQTVIQDRSGPAGCQKDSATMRPQE